MRIGFDAKRAFNNYSGLGNYSRYIISNICRFFPENDCFLYTPSVADPDLFIEPEGVTLRQARGGMGRLYKAVWRSLRLLRLLEDDGVQIYHGLSNEIPAGIHRTMIKSVITIHDLIFMEHPELYKPMDRFFYEKKVRYGASHSTRIIAVSEQTKQDIIRFLGVDESLIRVVYQGCHRQFYSRVSEESLQNARQQFALPTDYLLYVGTIEERKNLLKIVEAIHTGNIDCPPGGSWEKNCLFQSGEELY